MVLAQLLHAASLQDVRSWLFVSMLALSNLLPGEFYWWSWPSSCMHHPCKMSGPDCLFQCKHSPTCFQESSIGGPGPAPACSIPVRCQVLLVCFNVNTLQPASRRVLLMVLAQLLHAASLEAQCSCGVSPQTTRIIGGSDAKLHEFPWQVSLKTNHTLSTSID